jgi:hypothetical protein
MMPMTPMHDGVGLSSRKDFADRAPGQAMNGCAESHSIE